MAAVLASLLFAASLEVPFLPQTEALCGGAAAAMVFRYWGDVHADAQTFAPLVDTKRGGILATTLVSEVQRRGWRAIRFQGSIDALVSQLALERPVIVLIQDRPGRFHFVVVTGADDEHIVIHDSARGPFRKVPVATFTRLWAPSGFWALVILPRVQEAPPQQEIATSPAESVSQIVGGVPPSLSERVTCDSWLAQTVAAARAVDLEHTDSALEVLRRRCPDSSAVLRELAGVRFARHRWSEAASLAAGAIGAGDTDPFTWEVLASSRYMQDDLAGALEAWNHIGKPLVNLVQIHGILRTRFPIVSDMLGLQVNAVLTAEAYRRAERRLRELPDQMTAHIRYQPEPDGYVTVDVIVLEHPPVRHRPAALGVAAARSVVERETRVDVPGSTGQGELWSIDWRWWRERPKLAVSFAAPSRRGIPGVLHVDAGWERSAFAVGQAASQPLVVRESHVFGRFSGSDWLTSRLRYQWTLGADSWNGARRATMAGLQVEQRLLHNRVAVTGGGAVWIPVSAQPGFKTLNAMLTWRSSPTSGSPWGFVTAIGMDVVSAGAPLSVLPAAGDSRTIARLMRAHPLFDDGVMTSSLVGRQLTFGNAEARRWFTSRLPFRVGVAGFVDAASVGGAGSPLRGGSGSSSQIDIGSGIRIGVPGYAGILRIDFGHGLRDNANAVTIGWQF